MAKALLIVAAAFCAQMVDGSLGMGYKAIASSLMLGFGVPPLVVTGTVHAASLATSAASGAAHWRQGNVVVANLKDLAIWGSIGALFGSLVALSVDGSVLRPVMSAILLLVGLRIAWRFWTERAGRVQWLNLPVLGAVGGAVDAVGGGGWGPIVTSGTIEHTAEPRTSIGTANAAEAFVSGTVAVVLLSSGHVSDWWPVVWLAVGGVLAAPIAARLTARLNPRVAGVSVGVLLVLLNVWNLT